MNHSVSTSPSRKKSRLSSPTYDAHFDELDGFDFQVLDEMETSFSHDIAATPVKSPTSALDRRGKRKRAIEDALKAARLEQHDDSGIAFVDSEGGSEDILPKSPNSYSPFLSSVPAFPPAASPPHATIAPKDDVSRIAPDVISADFLPVSLIVSAGALDDHVERSPSPEAPPEQDHEAWFAPISTRSSALMPTFASVSSLQQPPLRITGDAPVTGLVSTVGSQLRSKPTWASPSAAALDLAKRKLQTWNTEIEAEIENEMSAVEHAQEIVSGIHCQNDNKQPVINREPLKKVENATHSISTSDTAQTISTPVIDIHRHSTSVPVRPFKAPASTIPRLASEIPAPSALLTSVVSRSSAAAEFSRGGALPTPSHSLPGTPSKPSSLNAHPYNHSPISSTLPGPSISPLHQTTPPQKPRPLGLSPRAHAFTSSRTRPKFVTPFKKGIKPDDWTALQQSASMANLQSPLEAKGKASNTMPNSSRNPRLNAKQCVSDVGHAAHSNAIPLVKSKLVPRVCAHDELIAKGLDISLFNIKTVPHFLHYRFSTASTDASRPTTPVSLGSDSALETLLATGYNLATKAWVDNHWSLILWKMMGMACLELTKVEKRWSWNEVMRQLRYRYTRELASGSRPALRLIAAQDAPSSGPLVLCISNIFWKDEYVDSKGNIVSAHPELEITDGWYRLRATVDEALARAARKKHLRIGRKLACNGARLESTKKGPMEILDAYGSTHLILSGNSTHLAPWHAKLGFQSASFVATLRSLTVDGGVVTLADLLITQVHPVGFIEFIKTDKDELIRIGPRTEADEALEADRWNARRSHEAARLQDKFERKWQKLESYADRLEQIAGSEFRPTEDDSPPDNIEELVNELEDNEDPTLNITGINRADAAWLSLLLRKKCETDREKCGDEIDRELALCCPPRQVRNFRVVRVKDARTARKPSWRIAQLTVWDVLFLTVTEGASPGSFEIGQRYLVSSLVPIHHGSWMGLEPESEIFLTTRADSKWQRIN